MELNKGPLCSKHTVLSVSETKALCYGTMTHGHNFPTILESDPQNIWIGGRVNEIIKIEPYSENTGQSVHYRIVMPDTGKTSQIRADTEPQWTLQKNEVITSSLETTETKNPTNVEYYHDDDIDDDEDNETETVNDETDAVDNESIIDDEIIEEEDDNEDDYDDA